MTSKVFHVRADTRVHLFLRALCRSLPCHRSHPGSAPECCLPRGIFEGSPSGSESKGSACDAGDPDPTPESGRSPREGMATHSSILARRIPRTRSLTGHSPWGHRRVGHDLATERDSKRHCGAQAWQWTRGDSTTKSGSADTATCHRTRHRTATS